MENILRPFYILDQPFYMLWQKRHCEECCSPMQSTIRHTLTHSIKPLSYQYILLYHLQQVQHSVKRWFLVHID